MYFLCWFSSLFLFFPFIHLQATYVLSPVQLMLEVLFSVPRTLPCAREINETKQVNKQKTNKRTKKDKQQINNDNNNHQPFQHNRSQLSSTPRVNARERCLTLHQPTAAGAPLHRPDWQTGAHRQSDWLPDCITPLSRHSGHSKGLFYPWEDKKDYLPGKSTLLET